MIAAHCVGSSPARSRTSRIALAFVLASYLLPGIVSSSFPQTELRTKPRVSSGRLAIALLS